jgi:hypothetical protein
MAPNPSMANLSMAANLSMVAIRLCAPDKVMICTTMRIRMSTVSPTIMLMSVGPVISLGSIMVVHLVVDGVAITGRP